jgi:hypothetical protein
MEVSVSTQLGDKLDTGTGQERVTEESRDSSRKKEPYSYTPKKCHEK